MKKQYALLIFFNVSWFIIFGQAPSSFKYQAVVRDANNAILVNQTIGVRMQLIQGSTNGTVVYSESFSVQTNAYGLIHLEIGNGTVIAGVFQTVDWSQGPYFLETAIDNNGGSNYAVVGTSQLLSVPYALYAENSGSSIAGPPGPAGTNGINGTNGVDGKSAYEVAVANGFIGTESEWLTSLEGEQGPAGNTGLNGTNGLDGKSAYELAVENGFSGTESDWLTSLIGEPGIQGPAGANGVQGPSGLLSNGSETGNTPYWNGSNWVVNSNNIYNAGGSVGIGTTTPNLASKLDISSNTQGFLPPRMTVTQRNAITNPVDGLMIFNTSSGCPNYFFSGAWQEWCGANASPLATISGLSCGNSSFIGDLIMNVPASGSTITLPYTGGNTGTYPGQSFTSSGVNGLTATIGSGVVANGAGSLTLSISGTPDNSGTATFTISYLNYTCTITKNVGLPAPNIVSSNPASPTNSTTTPTLVLTGPANKTIQLYPNSNGSGTPIATTTTNNMGNATIQVNINPNSTNTFTAKASDGLGNESTLSNVYSFIHDNTAPTTPSIVSLNPISPSTSTTPSITINGDPGALIQLYNGTSCSGSILSSSTVGANGTVVITLNVSPNSTNQFTCNSMDAAGNLSSCSNTVTYVHDNIAPARPSIISSNPTSPSNYFAPTLIISGEPGSQIRVYKDNMCSSAIAATGIVGAAGTASVNVTVIANTTTSFTASSIDASGNVSPCSDVYTYINDATPPLAPVITGSVPSSPSPTINPSLTISNSEPGTLLTIYSGNTCSGAPIATISNTGLTASATVSVTANATSIFTAKSRDASGNVSSCSAAYSYTHDATAPLAPTITSTPASPSSTINPSLTISNSETGTSVIIYSGNACSGAPITTINNAGLTASTTVSVAANSITTFSAKSIDAAGNNSSCSTGFSYTHDAIAPPTPIIVSTSPASPSSSSTSPTVNFTNDEVGTSILVYSGNSCSGNPITTINNAGATASTTVNVSSNSTSSFSAKTRDAAGNLSPCSSSISYTHDSSPPAAPTITSSIPSSPGDAINPLLKVTSEANSMVYIYPNGSGTGSPIANAQANASGDVWFGPYYTIILNSLITVNNGSMNKFTAKSVDAAGNISSLSSIFPYNHVSDNIAPGVATITGSSPASPANSSTPELIVTCEPGARVNIYKNLTATGSIIAYCYDTDYNGVVNIPVTAIVNSSNAYSARQTDASGNVSASFSTFTYTHVP